jgi:hypothetical protein
MLPRRHSMTRLMALCAIATVTQFTATVSALAQFPGQEPPCFKDFAPLRDDAQKKAMAIQAASKRKAPPQEACGLFNAFYAAEGKVLKFAEKNGTWCGIPPQAIKQMKENHAKTAEIRGRVCMAAKRPAGPSLSDALNAPRVPNANNIKPGSGTFDTLTGTPLGNR